MGCIITQDSYHPNHIKGLVMLKTRAQWLINESSHLIFDMPSGLVNEWNENHGDLLGIANKPTKFLLDTIHSALRLGVTTGDDPVFQ